MIPDWFWEAVETPSREHRVEVDGCDVVWRDWGDPERPGLLLVHGMSAHSRWWDFIAPQLTDAWRPVALDLTGMGDSDYRHDYSMGTYAEELVAVADAAGLGPDVPIVAHSFGGRVAIRALQDHPERFGPLVLADSAVRTVAQEEARRARGGPGRIGGAGVLYPTRADAERRFRLQPPQPVENPWIVEYIARHSVMPLEDGWAWKFDDELLDSLRSGESDRGEWLPRAFATLPGTVTLLHGAESAFFDAETLATMRALRPGEALRVEALADARHHLFVDQPLAFVEALRHLLPNSRS